MTGPDQHPLPSAGPGPEPFDLCGPLPTGTTVLEASAGTGKTYAVGALVARFIAESAMTLADLLVVTFGRAASQEMRERVRHQLVRAERALRDPQGARADPDRLLRHLADGTDAVVQARRLRLADALADFDSATIATTHQFCQQVLFGLGVAGDTDPAARLIEDLDEVIVDSVDDLYLRAFGRHGADTPAFSRSDAQRIAAEVVGDPQARIEPTDAAAGTEAAIRRQFAEAARTEVERRKRFLGLVSYDDLLSGVADALRDPSGAARDRMRRRWRVVVVDEFQDTDPVQWQVIRQAFVGHATVVLIGDPKQAIYAFRGGDVVTYLAAVRQAGGIYTLDTNWRSDAPLTAAVAGLIGGAELGDPAIVVRPVRAARVGSRLHGAPDPAPFRLRVVDRDAVGRRSGNPPVATVRRLIAQDLAADIARLLDSGATVDGRPIRAGDIAVLTATNDQAGQIGQELTGLGIPAVVGAAGSVYGTPAAHHWIALLQALDQPHRADLARSAALTPFLGLTAHDLGTGGDRLSDELTSRLRRWTQLMADRGVAAVVEAATADGLWRRLLGRPDGERELTDLRHVAEGLHALSMTGEASPGALVQWLRDRAALTILTPLILSACS